MQARGSPMEPSLGVDVFSRMRELTADRKQCKPQL